MQRDVALSRHRKGCLASPEIRETMDELRSEEKEEKEAHLKIGKNMCKDPVAGRSTVSVEEEPGSLEQGDRGRKEDTESIVGRPESAPQRLQAVKRRH